MPIYHIRWQHRALYNNTNYIHTHMRAHTHTHTVSDEGMGRAVKNSLEIIIKQVHLEGGFERGGRIRVAECLRQIVPDRWASIRIRPTLTSKTSLKSHHQAVLLTDSLSLSLSLSPSLPLWVCVHSWKFVLTMFCSLCWAMCFNLEN